MTSTNYDDFAFLRPESEIDILQLSQNVKHHDQATSIFALWFSQALIDSQHDHRFERNNKRVDVVLNKFEISAVHFCIDFNWTNDQMIIINTFFNNIVVESFNGEVKLLRQTFTLIFSNDIIQVALIRFRLIISSHDEETYNWKWQAYRKSVLVSLPFLNDLTIQRNFALTMQNFAKLSLLPQEKGKLPAIQKTVDCCETFYAVKRWSKKKEDHQIRKLIHVITLRLFCDYYANCFVVMRHKNISWQVYWS